MTQDEIVLIITPYLGKFTFVDLLPVNMGVGHLYCLDHTHITFASERYSGMLSDICIEEMEKKKGPSCGVKGCQASYKEHTYDYAILLKLQSDIPNAEAAGILKQIVEHWPKEARTLAGFSFLETEEKYRILPPED